MLIVLTHYGKGAISTYRLHNNNGGTEISLYINVLLVYVFYMSSREIDRKRVRAILIIFECNCKTKRGNKSIRKNINSVLYP